MIRRILRGALVGAATVFASKLPHQHWSTPPTAIVVAPERGGALGGEGGPTGRSTPAIPPAGPSRPADPHPSATAAAAK